MKLPGGKAFGTLESSSIGRAVAFEAACSGSIPDFPSHFVFILVFNVSGGCKGSRFLMGL